ncbi:hypothetical protein [Tessaracoccus sp. OH4464_COT-324]|uniref:hypothetical protein n=1 Tax=Tessaracoccus sp. OH4464_COT-324 TaxID=2491059 RepID=UPI000F62F95B|nr:hypothetical protein [Tessaracoccus sp. OH4464_COT-324]RRD44262.1 hypothetical protein EII42_11970 [Tessaracoccus sp. OH4464_COT-324]
MMSILDAIAGGLAQLAKWVKENVQGAPSSGSDEYKKLAGLLRDIETERERILKEDERKSLSWWDKIKVTFSDITDWWKAKGEFDDKVATIKKRSEDGMEKLRAVCELVLKEQDVPDDLRDKRDQWQEAARLAQGVYETAPQREAIAGWEGPASERYKEMAKVQTAACAEWSQMVEKMAETFSYAYEINLVVQTAVYEQFSKILDPLTCTPGEREFFAPTAEFGNRLHACADWASEVIKQAEDAGESLDEFLRGLRSSPQLLTDKWPQGTAKSGTQPANLGPGPKARMNVETKGIEVDNKGAIR